MTDAEITRRVMTAMGLVVPPVGLRALFDPLHDANHEQRVREWVRGQDNTTRSAIAIYLADAMTPATGWMMLDYNTGDLTRAVAQWLEESDAK